MSNLPKNQEVNVTAVVCEIAARLTGCKALSEANEARAKSEGDAKVYGYSAQQIFDRGNFPKRCADIKVADCKGERWNLCFQKILGKLNGTGATIAFVGGRGRGKTLLATCLAKKMVNAGQSVLYTTAAEFFLEIKATYGNSDKSEMAVMHKFQRPRFLVIDEMQVRGETKWEEEKLTALIDKRYRDERDTVVIANLKPDELAESVGQSISRRISDTGGVAEADWERWEGR